MNWKEMCGRGFVLALGLAVLSSGMLFAGVTASISGTVNDSSGAAIERHAYLGQRRRHRTARNGDGPGRLGKCRAERHERAGKGGKPSHRGMMHHRSANRITSASLRPMHS